MNIFGNIFAILLKCISTLKRDTRKTLLAFYGIVNGLFDNSGMNEFGRPDFNRTGIPELSKRPFNTHIIERDSSTYHIVFHFSVTFYSEMRILRVSVRFGNKLNPH